MVEELARWKAALNQKATDLQEALKRVLEERGKARESLLNTYRYTGFEALLHISVTLVTMAYRHLILCPQKPECSTGELRPHIQRQP
jgi:hypothetical protein